MPEALVISDTGYNGEATSYMITKNVLEGKTIQGGNIYVEDGIKKKRTIPRVDVTNIMQARKATPTSSGTIAVDGAVIEVQDLMMYMEFNPRDFENQWYAAQLNPTLLDAKLPATAEYFITMQMMKRLNEFFEFSIWRSRKDYDPEGTNLDPTTKGALATDKLYFYFDGILKKLLAASETIKVPNAVALTSSNIVDKFQAAYLLVPQALLYRYGDLKLFVSYTDQQKYEQYMQTQTLYKNQDTTEKGINRYNGYDVVPLPGIPENTFIWAIGTPDTSSNLWMGINSTEDANLQLMRLQNNSELFFIKGLFKADVQVGFKEEVVLYTTITA